MTAPVATRRAAMTLVELLVVVAIIGLLAATVLPTLANSSEGRRTREATRSVTSFIAQSQSRALGHATGAGFALVKTGSLPRNPALELAAAAIPEVYRGDTPTAAVSLVPLGSGSMTLSFTPPNSSFQTVSSTTGDLIRFDGRGAWYSLQGSGTPTSCSLRSAASVDELAGQTAMNTPWPSASASHAFEVMRGPQRTSGGASLGDQRCIDTFWSFAGSRQLSGTVTGNPPSIYVIFDAAGSVRQVTAGQDRFSPDGPIMLLVGRVDRAGQGAATLSAADDTVGANWQYDDSQWVAIDLLSGLAKSAPCTTGTSNATQDVTGSQAYIRSALTPGGP